MSRRRWHMDRSPEVVTLSRHVPVRFDVSASTRLPSGLRRGALAHEIRKDIWRALQGVRGFSPAVEITQETAGLAVRAGGAIFGRMPPKDQTEQKIADVLSRPDLRERWIAHTALSCEGKQSTQETAS